MESLRILIVDDHQAVRRGIRSLLSMHEDWSICGEAGDGSEAVEKVKDLRPDVVLMDLSMPRMGGVEATRIILREAPDAKVVIVSQNDPSVVRQQAREVGARAYVGKADLARDLLPTIENIVGENGNSANGHKREDPAATRVSAEARANAQRLRAVFDTSALGVAVLDLEMKFLEANEAFCVITGYSQHEIGSLDYMRVVHQDDRERMRAQIKRLSAGEIPSFVIDQRYVEKQGRSVWVQNSVSLTRDHAGNPLGIVLLCQEFTEHRRLLSQLRESEQRFREMVDALPVAIYTTDPEGRLTHFNPAAVKFSGRVPELGSTKWCVTWKLFYANGRPMPHDQCPMAIALKEGHAVEGVEAIAERPDGTRVWFTPYPRVLRDAEGKIVSGINMLLDITERKQAERTKNLLAAIVDSSDDAIVSKRLDGVITSWNKGAERIFGYAAKEAVGRHIGLIIPRDRLHEETEIIDRLKRGERVDHIETVRMRKDGELLDVSVTISPVRDASGSVVGASKVARDITERKRAEKSTADRSREHKALFHLADQLHRAESLNELYTAGLNAISDAMQCDKAAILLCDESGVMRFADSRGLSESYRKATEGHSPWPNDETNPAPICFGSIAAAEFSDAIRAAIEAEKIAAMAFIPLVSSRKLIGKLMIYFDAPHEFTQSETDLSLIIARQVAFGIDRKRSEEALRASEERFRKLSATLDAEVRARTDELEQRNTELLWRSEQLRDISRQMIRVQDAERRHIARELHDSAGQTLTVLGLNLSTLAKKVGPDLAPQAEETLEMVQHLSQEIRTTSYLLHPPLLDESGLADALNWYVEGLIRRSDLEIGVLISDNFGRLSPDIELVIFRLVQECLTNIHRHSGSKSATIRLARMPNEVCLEIEDYGKGIPAEKLAQIESQGSGVGIRGMSERVRQFDGELKIHSSKSGTKIAVRLPLNSIPAQAAANSRKAQDAVA
jgi:PAS domain S-box-containing protein